MMSNREKRITVAVRVVGDLYKRLEEHGVKNYSSIPLNQLCAILVDKGFKRVVEEKEILDIHYGRGEKKLFEKAVLPAEQETRCKMVPFPKKSS